MRQCSVPECGRVHYAHGFCYRHWRRVQRYGDPYAHIPIGHGGTNLEIDRSLHGPFICVCPTSRPHILGGWDLNACARCGYPCVYGMAEAPRRKALARWPFLDDQEVIHATEAEAELRHPHGEDDQVHEEGQASQAQETEVMLAESTC